MVIRFLISGALAASVLCGPALAGDKNGRDNGKGGESSQAKTSAPNQGGGGGNRDNDYRKHDWEKHFAQAGGNGHGDGEGEDESGKGKGKGKGRGHNDHGNGNGNGHCKGNRGNHDGDDCPISP